MAQQNDCPSSASGHELPPGENALRAILPAHSREFVLGSQTVPITERWLYFREYSGRSPAETRGKPIVGPPDRPFAELQVVQRLADEGWTAGWLNRSGTLIFAWEPRVHAKLPAPPAQALLARIEARDLKARCWDVVAWQAQLRFVQLVRGTSGKMSQEKLRWLEAALAEGVPASAFEVWRWFGGALKRRVIRLTSYTLHRQDGWAECRDGKMIYSAEGMCDADGKCDMIEHYRGWGAQTEADLLWLVFVRNCEGLIYGV